MFLFSRGKLFSCFFRLTLTIVNVPEMQWNPEKNNFNSFIVILRFESLLYSAGNSAIFRWKFTIQICEKEMTNNRICTMIDTNKFKHFDSHSTVYNYNSIKPYLPCRLY